MKTAFTEVKAQYLEAIASQEIRRRRQNRDNFTHNEIAAIKFYQQALAQITALEEQ